MSDDGRAGVVYVPHDDSGIWASRPQPVPTAVGGVVVTVIVWGLASVVDDVAPVIPALAFALVVAAVGAYGGTVVAVAGSTLAAVALATSVGGDQRPAVLGAALVGYGILGVARPLSRTGAGPKPRRPTRPAAMSPSWSNVTNNAPRSCSRCHTTCGHRSGPSDRS